MDLEGHGVRPRRGRRAGRAAARPRGPGAVTGPSEGGTGRAREGEARPVTAVSYGSLV
ncbi:hypothetical protein [Actinomadura kijaniata]|uniref:hypothetical protein n=1 Tax=Actinomadura kijaniata TaxID=46161 RepID=UPI0012F9FC36|nr:hypothetical protein [Actinomadura kijaniata]